MVLQKNVLFSGSIEENLRWGDENATMEEIQQCISTHAGKGIIQRTANGNWNNKELIIDENMEGYVIDIDGNLILTHRFMIHYSKDKGTHLVPTLRKE